MKKKILPGYEYEKLTDSGAKGQYMLYVHNTPYLFRKTVREIVAIAKAHDAKRKSANYLEPKLEINFFNPEEVFNAVDKLMKEAEK